MIFPVKRGLLRAGIWVGEDRCDEQQRAFTIAGCQRGKCQGLRLAQLQAMVLHRLRVEWALIGGPAFSCPL